MFLVDTKTKKHHKRNNTNFSNNKRVSRLHPVIDIIHPVIDMNVVSFLL